MNLAAMLISNGLVHLAWSVSNGGQTSSFLLDYIVLIKDGNGTIKCNTTVRNSSQLIISLADSCGRYEATVTPLCQGIVPMASIERLEIPGGK